MVSCNGTKGKEIATLQLKNTTTMANKNTRRKNKLARKARAARRWMRHSFNKASDVTIRGK